MGGRAQRRGLEGRARREVARPAGGPPRGRPPSRRGARGSPRSPSSRRPRTSSRCSARPPLAVVLHEEATALAVRRRRCRAPGEIVVVVGPEGGLTDEEVAAFARPAPCRPAGRRGAAYLDRRRRRRRRAAVPHRPLVDPVRSASRADCNAGATADESGFSVEQVSTRAISSSSSDCSRLVSGRRVWTTLDPVVLEAPEALEPAVGEQRVGAGAVGAHPAGARLRVGDPVAAGVGEPDVVVGAEQPDRRGHVLVGELTLGDVVQAPCRARPRAGPGRPCRRAPGRGG